ncbi:MAG: adenylyltransferase/cytidyltransferase family protein [Candidatus Micrarchaeota archaeon]
MQDIRELLVLQIKENGISSSAYSSLTEHRKGMLEPVEGKYFLKKEFRSKFKVVITGGAFDILHAGHIFALNEAKKYGNFLVLVVARDEMILKKGRQPVHNQEYRAFMLDFLKPVDLVLLGKEHPKEIFDQVKPDVIVYGYDQHEIVNASNGVEVVKLKEHFGGFKTSKIIKDLGT